MLNFNFHLTTPRLYLSYLNPANDTHCKFVTTLVNSPEVAKQRDPSSSVPDLEAGRKYIQDGFEKLERSGYGRYLISLRSGSHTNTETGTTETEEEKESALPFSQRELEHIGVVTMKLDRYPGAPTIPDVGFGLLGKYTGRGYATEAAQGLLTYFREEKGQSAFAGYCNPDNEASKKVLSRSGFEERGMRDISGIFGEGKVLSVLLWTMGVGEGEEELKRWGL